MPRLLAAMTDEHPAVQVEAYEAWDSELTEALRAGRLEALLGRHLSVPPTFRTIVLRHDPYAVFVGEQHHLARRDAVALRELRGKTLRFFPRRFAPAHHDAVLAAIHSTGETFDIWENPLPGLRNLAINLRDGGFMLLPQSLGEHVPGGVTRLPLTDDLPPIDLILSVPRRELTPACRILVKTARRLAHREGWTRPNRATARRAE